MSRRVRILMFAGLVALAVALFITSDPPSRDSSRGRLGGTASTPEQDHSHDSLMRGSEVRRYLSLAAFLAALMVTYSARGTRRVDEPVRTAARIPSAS